MNPILISIIVFGVATVIGACTKSKGGAKVVNAISALGSLILIWIGISGACGGISFSIGSPTSGNVLSGLWSITLKADPLSGFFLIILGILGFSASIYGISYLDKYRGNFRLYSFNYPLFILIMSLVLLSWNLLWFIVFWELMTLFSQFLVAFYRNEKAVKAAFKYFCMTKGGADLLLLSVAIFLLTISGFRVGYGVLSSYLPSYLSSHPFIFWLLAVYLLIGFGVKAGMVPLHSWIPDAYSEAPSNVSALLSGIMKKLPIYMLFRIYLTFFPRNFYLGILIGVFAVITMFFGNMLAFVQNDSKRIPSYSSIAQIGYVLLGLGAGISLTASGHTILGALALLASLYHVFSHAVSKGLLFLNAGAVFYATGTRNLDDLGALAKYMPATAFCGIIGAMSISGMPPFAGFLSKWMLYAATLPSIWIFSLFGIIAMFMSIATTIAFLKYYTAIFSGPEKKELKAEEVPIPMVVGQSILAGFSILLGVYPFFAIFFISKLLDYIGVQFQVSSYYILPGVVIPKVANFMPLLVIFVTFGLGLVLAFGISVRRTKVWTCGTPVEVNRMPSSGYYQAIVEDFKWVYSMAKGAVRGVLRFASGVKKVSLGYEKGSYELSWMTSAAMVFLAILVWLLGGGFW